MTVVANHFSDILTLADRQPFQDETFQRLRNYISLQYATCLRGLVPTSLTKRAPSTSADTAIFRERDLSCYNLKTMRYGRSEANALADQISLEMLIQNATMVVCRYSDEPFNTADVVSPHWSEVPFHAPSLLALLGVAGLIQDVRPRDQPRSHCCPAQRRLCRGRAAQSTTRRALTYVTTPGFLSHFGFQTLRDLPDLEMLEDAGLLSKARLLAENLPPGSGEGEGEDVVADETEELSVLASLATNKNLPRALSRWLRS